MLFCTCALLRRSFIKWCTIAPSDRQSDFLQIFIRGLRSLRFNHPLWAETKSSVKSFSVRLSRQANQYLQLVWPTLFSIVQENGKKNWKRGGLCVCGWGGEWRSCFSSLFYARPVDVRLLNRPSSHPVLSTSIWHLCLLPGELTLPLLEFFLGLTCSFGMTTLLFQNSVSLFSSYMHKDDAPFAFAA